MFVVPNKKVECNISTATSHDTLVLLWAAIATWWTASHDPAMFSSIPRPYPSPQKQCSFWKSWTKYEGSSVWHGCVLYAPPPPARSYCYKASAVLKPRREFNAIFLFIHEPVYCGLPAFFRITNMPSVCLITYRVFISWWDYRSHWLLRRKRPASVLYSQVI